MIDKITEIIEENQLTYYLGRTINGGIKTGKLAYSASKHFIDFSKSAAHSISTTINYLSPIEVSEREIQKIESKLYAAKLANHKENIIKYQHKLKLAEAKKKDIQQNLIKHKESYIAKTKLLQLKLEKLKSNPDTTNSKAIEKLEKDLIHRQYFLKQMGI